MAKISIHDIADSVIGKHGLSRNDAEAFVTAFFDLINDGLHSDKAVKVKGLGTFKVIDVRERESVDVNTGKRVVIESHGKITFTPDSVMRDLVNKPFAQFETVVLNDGVELEDLDGIQAQDAIDDKENSDVTGGERMQIGDEQDILVENVAFGNTGLSFANREVLPDNVVTDGDDNGFLPMESSDNMSEEHLKSPDCMDKPGRQEDYTGSPDVAETVCIDAVGDEDGGLHVVVKNEGCDKKRKEMSEPEQEKSVTDIDSLDIEGQESRGESVVAYSGKMSREVASCEDGRDFFSCHIWSVFVFSLLLVGAVGLFVGYYYGKSISEPVIKYVTVHAPGKLADTSHPVGSLPSKAYAHEKNTVTVTDTGVKKSEEKPSSVKTNTKEDERLTDSEPGLRDARTMVNTGAYRIVGTDRTVTVKKGESLKQISKFYLGDGMECYIQVYNGITEVKEGIKLKIPKLENKKKRK